MKKAISSKMKVEKKSNLLKLNILPPPWDGLGLPKPRVDGSSPFGGSKLL